MDRAAFLHVWRPLAGHPSACPQTPAPPWKNGGHASLRERKKHRRRAKSSTRQSILVRIAAPAPLRFCRRIGKTKARVRLNDRFQKMDRIRSKQRSAQALERPRTNAAQGYPYRSAPRRPIRVKPDSGNLCCVPMRFPRLSRKDGR